MAAALVVSALWLTRLLGTDIGLASHSPVWSRLPLQFSLALGPLLYFYVLTTIRPGYQFRRMDLLHFSPLLLELCAQVLPFAESLKTATFILNILAFVSVFWYLYLCRNTIDNFYTQKTLGNGAH
ncbi:hypothetical protein [Mucilaginibacter psychrotolerans]|uniref:hypothetical protein n=1 Tax=Mucilaginibacter psychrotolerans TaxID=1524096 RepID=UPI001057C7A0|nr:hypothetical protein [Mucilaginibacter psychrotolerans]